MTRAMILLFTLLSAHIVSAEVAIELEKDSPAISGNALVEAVGIEALGGAFIALLKQGCELPCEITTTYSTGEDDQETFSIGFVRGNEQMAPDNHSLGEFVVTGIAKAPKGESKTSVTLRATGKDLVLVVQDAAGKDLKVEKNAE